MIRISIRFVVKCWGFNGKAQSKRGVIGGIEVGLLQLSRPMRPFLRWDWWETRSGSRGEGRHTKREADSFSEAVSSLPGDAIPRSPRAAERGHVKSCSA
jgi:hypothetical protein